MKKQKQQRQQRHQHQQDNETEENCSDTATTESNVSNTGSPVMSEIKAKELIQKHEAERRASPKGLDVSTTLIRVGKAGEPPSLEEVPCIGKHWIQNIEPKGYSLPAQFVVRSFGRDRVGEVNHYTKHLGKCAAALQSLVTLQFNFFWSTVLHNPRIVPFLHSFVEGFPRPWARRGTVFSEDDAVHDLAEEVLSLVKQALLRLATRSESGSAFLTPAGYTQFVRTHRIFTARCVVAACAQYAATDRAFCTAFRALVDDYENIATGALAAGKAVLEDFVAPEGAPAICAQLMHSDPRCVLDAAASIAAALRVCPPAVAEIFYSNKLLVTVSEAYNSIAAASATTTEVRDDESDDGNDDEKSKIDEEVVGHTLKCLLACAAHVVNAVFVVKLREAYRKADPAVPESGAAADKLIGEFLDVISQWNTAPSKRFIGDFAKSTHLAKRVSRLANEFPNTM